jgi:hypothetical protein
LSISDGKKGKTAVAVFYSDRESWLERRKLVENLLGSEYSLSLLLLWFVLLWSFKFIFCQCWGSPQGPHAQGFCHWATLTPQPTCGLSLRAIFPLSCLNFLGANLSW